MKNQIGENIRDNRLDLIRVVSMLMVFAQHTSRKPLMGNELARSIIYAVILLCNGLFFMLSGQLNLNRKFEDFRDTVRFYLNRIITIILPFIFVSLVMSVFDIINSGESLSVLDIIKRSYVEFFGDHSGTHLWFVYWLVGFILSTPVLAKAFKNMTDNELTLLFALAIAWNIVSIYMMADKGLSFGFTGWILNGWMIAYFSGYYVSRVINSQNERWLYIIGALGFSVTILGSWLIPDRFLNAYDLSPAYTLYAMTAYYILSRKLKPLSGKHLNTILLFIAKHSYTAYLIHEMVNHFVRRSLSELVCSNTFYFCCSVTCLFVISLTVAVVADELLIFPVSKKLKQYISAI